MIFQQTPGIAAVRLVGFRAFSNANVDRWIVRLNDFQQQQSNH
jgi:hypothetical protein